MVGSKTYKGKQLSGKIYESKQLKNSKQVRFRSTHSNEQEKLEEDTF